MGEGLAETVEAAIERDPHHAVTQQPGAGRETGACRGVGHPPKAERAAEANLTLEDFGGDVARAVELRNNFV